MEWKSEVMSGYRRKLDGDEMMSAVSVYVRASKTGTVSLILLVQGAGCWNQ